ncbi:MFS general substrate transporter [Hesseltinella vesiculosa]|uniref:MFS general substrate transporter n=1 Tax=Hesseltinella vesiculosa TaxID=101127 RepID=A0A1X2GC23_9FUNG|nr:MFS general substrate transporter [Hesseltinella vesiculosa]
MTTEENKATNEGVIEDQVSVVSALEDQEHPELIAREKALVRKFDKRIMPMLTILYICQRLDLSNIGNAKVAGLQDDLGLSNSTYSWVISIYVLGVIAVQIPSNMLLERSRPSLFISFFVTVWSVVSIFTSFTHDFKTLAVARFFLGITEAPFFPCSTFLLSLFYKPREIAVRNAIFYCGNWLSGALGGAFAGAIITGMEGVAGMRGWRWLFIIEGIITFVIGIGSYWVLPDYPQNTKWLTEDERDLAVRRIGLAPPKEKFDFNGLWSALTEYKVWVFIVIFMAIQTAGQLNFFLPTIIQNLGYTGAMIQYMTIPVYVWAAILSLIVALLSDRYQIRSVGIAFCMLMALCGYAVQISQTSHGVLYMSLFLCGGGVWASLGVSLAWLGDCLVLAGRQKRAVSFAMLNCISQLANFYGPQLYTDPPRYIKANIVILTYVSIGICLCFGLSFLLRWENKKLDAKYGPAKVSRNTVIPGGLFAEDVIPETGVSKHNRYLL